MGKVAYIIFLIFFFFTAVVCFSQGKPAIKVVASRDRILLGEQFDFSIELTLPIQTKFSSFPVISDTSLHLEVISRSSIDSSYEGKFKKYRQTLTMTGFDSGKWKLPLIKYPAGKEIIQSNILQIEVVPVSLKGNDYNDIHEIVEVSKPSFQWWKLWLVSVLVVVALLFYFYWRKRSGVAFKSSPREQGIGAFERAIIQMNRLKAENLIESKEMKKFYSSLYDILRVYMSVKYTDDMVMDLSAMLEKEYATKGVQGLRVCEAVKFAKYMSSPSEADSTWRTFYKILELLNAKNRMK